MRATSKHTVSVIALKISSVKRRSTVPDETLAPLPLLYTYMARPCTMAAGCP